MSEENLRPPLNALGRNAAYQLSDVAKTVPQYEALTPRWLPKFIELKGIETGVYRVNSVAKGETPLDALCGSLAGTEEIPSGFIDYSVKPREYRLNSISTIINIDTRAQDLYGAPYDQTETQMNLAVEILKERQESQIINNPDYGLLPTARRRVKARKNVPTPDDMDELLSKVWKEPSFFLAHPRAIAAFLRECTRRGVTPASEKINGGVFTSWRGVPILPTDKLFIDDLKNPESETGITNILLVRTGEKKRGAIALYQKNVPNELSVGMSLRLRGINDDGVASYLISLYCSAAVLADDAVGVLEGVEIGEY